MHWKSAQCEVQVVYTGTILPAGFAVTVSSGVALNRAKTCRYSINIRPGDLFLMFHIWIILTPTLKRVSIGNLMKWPNYINFENV